MRSILESRRADTFVESRDVPFFDAVRVPVKTIELTDGSTCGLSSRDFEVIGRKLSYQVAQLPGSYAVIKYVRAVIKRRDTQEVSCLPTPVGVLEGFRADVSFIAAVLVEKVAYGLPLQRQQARMVAAGFRPSRHWLMHLAQRAVELLEPIYQAQFESIRCSRLRLMDATPLEADPGGHGGFQGGYFWSVYGGDGEVCFPFFNSPTEEGVRVILGAGNGLAAVSVIDGSEAYRVYAEAVGIASAHSWGDCRQAFVHAQVDDREGSAEALRQIAELYVIERETSALEWRGEAKRLHRLTYSKPISDSFFAWVRRQLEGRKSRTGGSFSRALHAALERQPGLECFLMDPEIPLDALCGEQGARGSGSVGGGSWVWCCSEIGARYYGIAQSLMVTCRLHGIDPYTYLVDVLQRVDRHPASRVRELTPRVWQGCFGDAPLGGGCG